jgi:Flp pilus assembly protein CpaB
LEEDDPMKRAWLDGLRFSGAGLYFAGAALLAMLAGLSVWSLLAGQAPTESVWALSRAMAPGEVVQAADLVSRSVPAGAAPPQAIKSRDEAVGKRLRYGLAAGDLVRAPHLVDGKSDVAQQLTAMGPAFRLLSLPANSVPAAQRLVPGDRLEVTAVLPLTEKGAQTSVAVDLGEVVVVDLVGVQDGEKGSVFVAVTAEQLPRIAVSQKTGTITYALLGEEAKAAKDSRLRLDPDLVNPTRAGG